MKERNASPDLTKAAHTAVRKAFSLLREVGLQSTAPASPESQALADVERWVSSVYDELTEARSSAESRLRSRLEEGKPSVEAVLDELADVIDQIQSLLAEDEA
jgi:hypothetical protein